MIEEAKPQPDSAAHPESVLRTRTGGQVLLKAHRCLWSGDYPENSLAALEECLMAPVARAELDISMLSDTDFLVLHDVSALRGLDSPRKVRQIMRLEADALRLAWHGEASVYRPPLLSEVVACLTDLPGPTVLELDMLDSEPLPANRVEELLRIVEPVKARVLFTGSADWNLRQLHAADPTVVIAFDPWRYLDWVPVGAEAQEEVELPRGAYRYLDAHPLARVRLASVAQYIHERFEQLVRLVSGCKEMHLRLLAFERMVSDSVTDLAAVFHRQGMQLDVWTLDADTPDWRHRLVRAVDQGVDIITTNTPRQLAKGLEI